MERPGLGQAVLPGRRVEDEERLGSCPRQALVDDPADLGQFVHQVRLRVEASGRVRDHEVRATGYRGVQGVVDDGPGIRAGSMGDDRDTGPIGPDTQLVDGGGSERVGGGEDDRPILGDVPAGELADGRRLTRAVDTDHQDDGRTARDRRSRAPAEVTWYQEGHQFGPHRSFRSARVAPCAGARDEIHGQCRSDIAGDERLLHLVPRRTVARLAPEDAA